MPQAFISYVRENGESVGRLADVLRAYDIGVWLDRDQLRPGTRWKSAIRQAISEGDFFIACFSVEYQQRVRSYMNEELTLAVDELRQRPTDRAWFIPVLVNEREVPDRDIGAGETLRSLQWVDLYKDWEDGVRRILSVIEPKSAKLYQLQNALMDQSARVRIQAADELGKLGVLARQAVPTITQLLEDQNETVRAAAASALGNIGAATDKVISKLLRVMRRGDFYDSRHAANALAKLGYVAVPALLETRKYSGYGVAAHAEDALAAIDDPAAVPVLIEEARKGSMSAVEGLARIGRKAIAAVPLLVELVRHGSEVSRWGALETLGRIGDPTVIPVLTEQLSASNARTRWSTVEALGRIGERSTIPLIVNALQDSDGTVRSHTAEVLGLTGEREFVSILAKSLEDSDLVVRTKSAEALGIIGDAGAVQPPIRAPSDDANVCAAAAKAMGKLRHIDAVPALIRTLQHERDWVKSSAVDALLAIGSQEAVQAVRELGEY
jgi:HEAT repeat protein